MAQYPKIETMGSRGSLETMAQYPKIEAMGSQGSILSSDLEVQLAQMVHLDPPTTLK